MIRFTRTLCLCATILSGLIASTVVFAQVSSADLLEQAWRLESNGSYREAALAYRSYLASKPAKSAESRHTRIKLPVLEEAVKYGAGAELDLYLSALNARAAGDTQNALLLLARITTEYPSTSLVDDARYLQAYIQMMDNFDFRLAHDTLQALRYAHPQSRYYDTALYSEAISQEQLGNRQLAIDKMKELRDRHTGVTLAGFAWPRDEYISRLWFQRSNDRLEFLQNHQQTASTLVSLDPYGEYGFAWRAVVSVNSQDFNLLLNRSQVTQDTKMVDGDGATINTGNTGAFAGRVEGEPDSWVRITIAENNLRGMISVYGERHKLVPTQTGGTLSDFHPLLLGDIDGNASHQQDHILHPPKNTAVFDDYMRSIKLTDKPTFENGTVGLTGLIGVVIDSKFNNYHGGRGSEEARAILNTADGIFREELGLALQIDTIVVIDSQQNDPMNLGSVTMETMMRNFSEYRKESSALDGDIAMATLFSGNKNSDSALGLAWIGSACRTDGYDVSVVSPYRLAELLSSHEIAHTLGASHDSDTLCRNNQSNVMWPYLSSTTRRTFSSCSKEAIHQVITNRDCFIDTLDIGIELDMTKNDVAVTTFNYDGTRKTSGSTVIIETKALANLSNVPGACSLQGTTLNCTVGELEPAASKEISLQFATPLTDRDKVIATARPIGFMDSEPDNNAMSGDINGNIQILTSNNINSDPGSPSGARPTNNNISASGSFSWFDSLLVALMLLFLGHRQSIRQHMKISHV